jgi:regulator of sirC expression with transglutaminase-like and TPR domain
MSARLDLTLFAHLCARPDPELDLAEAALLIASAEYPDLNVGHYIRALDELGRGAADAAARVRSDADEARLERVVRYIYEDAGFRGNDADYYDPRNSFLNDVIDRRTGIPITLALVLGEVCRRAGVEAAGVSFPGHFLVRCDTRFGTVLVDPFAGRPINRDELRALYARAGGDGDPPARMLEPATKKDILVRMLNNLRAVYEQRSDVVRLRGVIEHLYAIAPSDALRKRIVELGGSEPWRTRGSSLN